MLIKIRTKNSKETQKLGKKLAKDLLIGSRNGSRKNALVLALEGELGGGKTTFTQGFAEELGIKEKILSPTFVILKKFPIPTKAKDSKNSFRTFYHIDCYRIQKPGDILTLGFDEIIKIPQNIVFIEWAEKIKDILPKDTIILKFNFIGKNQREIILRS